MKLRFSKCSYKLIITLLLSLPIAFITSCAHPPPTPQPKEFDMATRTLAQELLKQINDHRIASNDGAAIVVIDPFFDADSGEVLNVSKQIEAIFQEEQQKSFPNVVLRPLRSDTLAEAQYILRGDIRLETIETEKADQKFYHVMASADNRKRVVAWADVWIADKDLDYTGAGIHADTPMFIIDPNQEKARTIIESGKKTTVEPESAEFLETKAILVEAGAAYENKDYEKALRLFQKAVEREDGQVMETYAGLYLSHYVLNHRRQAEEAFAQLVDISVSKNGSLSVKFLFEVNKTEFLKNKNLRAQYAIWIKIIGEYFRKSDTCLKIVGHCSKTGPADWNDKLSKMRARRIQSLMRSSFPEIKKRSQAIGKGYHENIVGTGTDDERDALDRRVEFILTDCGSLNLSS